MTEQDEFRIANQVIDTLKAELDRHPEILIATKSGRLLTEPERLEFFRGLQGQGQVQLETINPLIKHIDPVMTSLYLQQTPNDEIMETITRFGSWVAGTFSDPGLLKDSAQAIAAISKAYNSGAPINTAGSSILPVIIQIGAKILGLG